ncbi:alpha-amylase family glycosyl hydrolase [Luteolibacter marinus]|uniref:alpha-amylase family glycosyl hydrolase n=1 Tax=Luteolibacter marinus TaxID=2776705 RepID=UPI001867DAAC|nr:alpha-amylase family glycosyl hydrolase [Luteolibacter marinus]
MICPRRTCRWAALLSLLVSPALRGEVILQYFNTRWTEITRRMPELAEAGYTALWLPQPAKCGSGAYSVGYDPLDRFDLGDKNQAGTVATRYGTKAELLRLVETAHRFGLRVYFDNVMAHSAGPLDDVPPGTLLPGIPGFVPEDFHLVKREGGGWRKATDSLDYNDEWQVLNRNPFAWDIAQENPNTSFDATGQNEGTDHPKWSGIRHPGRTELYPDTDLPGVADANGVIFHPFADKEPFVDANGNGRFDWTDTNGNGQHDAGEAGEAFTDTGVDPTVPEHQTAAWGHGDGIYNMGNPVAEDVNGMLIRSIRWTIDQTACDGFRLDAVKHVPSYFFGLQGGDKDPSSAGYLGGAQAQFNLSRGFADWSNHRNSCYSTNAPRDDLMLYGEHLGAPPNPADYLAAGMRVANDDFLNNVGGFAGIGSTMANYDEPGKFTFGVNGGMMYCLSHDNNYMAGSERPAAHQYMLTRAGLPIVYTDGYNHSADHFPKQAHIPFLGQYGQQYVTGSLRVRRDFIRGDQWPKYQGQDACGWEFRDYSESPGMSDANATTLVVMHARNYTGGQQMPFGTVFAPGSRLKNYSPHGGPFHASVGGDGKLRADGSLDPVIIPSGGYFAFSYDVPELPALWQGTGVEPIQILENGVPAATIAVERKDGANGDPAYTHTVQVPRVTDPANLRFIARTDGSANNVLMKLDAGIDLNSQMGFTAGRDNPPGVTRDMVAGYEQMRFVARAVEKFAARTTNTGREIIGSPGAETWQCTIGSAGFTRNDGGGVSTDTGTADWVYHGPGNADINGVAGPQFSPAPADAAGQPVTVWTKVGYAASGISHAWLYYTTDGTTYPEGSMGAGKGATQVAAMAFDHDGTVDGGGTPQWWKTTLPALPDGTVLRYKIGVHKTDAPDRFPFSKDDVTLKQNMETIFEIADFDATTCTVFPNADNGIRHTGLREGFHFVSTRAFLNRGGAASLFKTSSRTFYYDVEPPSGEMAFPAENATIGGSSYGFVVLTDASVTGVQFNILDTDAGNDGAADGNGAGQWAAATEVTPTQLGTSGFAREWRFDYKQIPSSGAAVVQVRLREASSSPDNNLDDAGGWFTTLTRNIDTGYPVNYRIEYPTTDGATVDMNYQAKVYFDKSLGYIAGEPVPAAQMTGEFEITLDGALIPREGYTFIADETGSESALAFHFPNFYTGNPDQLSELRATWQRGNITLSDIRLVKAAPGAILDSDGDGLPDYWEIQHGLDPNNPDGDEGAESDKDGDGLSAILEFLADFDPGDPADGHLLTPVISPDGGTWRLQFPVIPNRIYQVEACDDLGSWEDLGASFSVTEANPMHFWTDPAPVAGPRFYRVSILLP